MISSARTRKPSSQCSVPSTSPPSPTELPTSRRSGRVPVVPPAASALEEPLMFTHRKIYRNGPRRRIHSTAESRLHVSSAVTVMAASWSATHLMMVHPPAPDRRQSSRNATTFLQTNRALPGPYDPESRAPRIANHPLLPLKPNMLAEHRSPCISVMFSSDAVSLRVGASQHSLHSQETDRSE